MSILRSVLSLVPTGLAVLSGGVVSGQEFPNKVIRIVASNPGGSTDFTARLLATGISNSLGQPVIVENRPPVGAIELVAKAPADGYTLFVSSGTVWILPLLQSVSWDVVRDFSPISQLGREVLVVAVHPSIPVKSVRELIALAKARPGELNFGASTGGTSYLATQLLKSMAGINVVWVPYKGSAAALTALLGGEVQLTVSDVGLVMPHAKTGRLRPLAVTSAEPSALTPGLPTVAETVSGYQSGGLITMFAPGKTPASIINRLNLEIVRFVNRPEVRTQFLGNAVEVVGSSPEQFAATIKSEIAKWGKVIKDAGIKLD
jgi:tripartite-type tricarboxylate transporter receptor subunit TctC